jgi:hypothetical protein
MSWRIDHLHEFVSKPNLRVKRQPVARFLRFRFDVPGARHGNAFDRLAPGVDDPIALPDGRTLITLRDAASCITARPKKEADAPAWQAAIEAAVWRHASLWDDVREPKWLRPTLA